MRIKSTLETEHYKSTILSASATYFGDDFSINPYSGGSYTAGGASNYRKGVCLWDKYLINANITYTGSAGSIYITLYAQLIPNDTSEKLEYSQAQFETYSGAAINIYQNDNLIMYRYRATDLSYRHRELNLSTGTWTDRAGEPSGSVMETSGISFNGYSAEAVITVVGGSGSYTLTPTIRFTI